VPRYRVVGNKALNLLTNVKMAEKLSDTQCGFRAYSRKALGLIAVSESGIGVDSQILLDASAKGLRIVEFQALAKVRVGGLGSRFRFISANCLISYLW
jgi:hypothetical protein